MPGYDLDLFEYGKLCEVELTQICVSSPSH